MSRMVAPARRLSFALRRNNVVRNSTDDDLLKEWQVDLTGLAEETRWPAWRRFLMANLLGYEPGAKVLTGLEINRISNMAGTDLESPIDDAAYHLLSYAAFERMFVAARDRRGGGAGC